jgi:hypothetical protein
MLIATGAVMLPWLGYLAMSLPGTAQAAHWATAWTGLDALEIAGLVGSGLLLRRPGPQARAAVSATAAATAALLLVDAWFDVTTAATSQDLTSAIVLAVLAELPMATLLATLAWRHTRPAAAPAPTPAPMPVTVPVRPSPWRPADEAPATARSAELAGAEAFC